MSTTNEFQMKFANPDKPGKMKIVKFPIFTFMRDQFGDTPRPRSTINAIEVIEKVLAKVGDKETVTITIGPLHTTPIYTGRKRELIKLNGEISKDWTFLEYLQAEAKNLKTASIAE